jgi:hypothetical protein
VDADGLGRAGAGLGEARGEELDGIGHAMAENRHVPIGNV